MKLAASYTALQCMWEKKSRSTFTFSQEKKKKGQSTAVQVCDIILSDNTKVLKLWLKCIYKWIIQPNEDLVKLDADYFKVSEIWAVDAQQHSNI